MLKLFDNCAVLKFGRGNKNITGMIRWEGRGRIHHRQSPPLSALSCSPSRCFTRPRSSEKESFDFRTPVPIEGAVELWMTGVEAEMRKTLYQITKEGAFYYAKTAR